MAHLTEEQIEQYQKRLLSPEQIVEVAAHLQECDHCQASLLKTAQFQRSIVEIKDQFSTEDHVEYEDLAGFVDGTIDDVRRKTIDSHLADCRICRLQIDDLRQLREELKIVPFRKPAPALKYLAAAALAIAALAAVWLFRNSFIRTPGEIVKKHEVNPVPPVLTLKDKERSIELDQSGKIRPIPGIENTQLVMMQQAITSQHLPIPSDLNKLSPQPGVLLGEKGEQPFGLINPVGKVILTDKPEFEWEPFPKAKDYQVAVMEDSMKVAAVSPRLTGTSWQTDRELGRGKTYAWQVTARTEKNEITVPAPPLPEAFFKIVEKSKWEQIENAKKSDAPHLLLAILYADSGLIQQAQEELEQLRLQNPDSPVVASLTRSLKTR